MSPSEIAFLALGLVLGSAAGAAVLAVARSRSGPTRFVRVTITPNAISPRRAWTLAEPDGARIHGSIPGSPDDDAHSDDPGAGTADGGDVVVRPPGPRTRVPSGPASLPAAAVAIPIVRGPGFNGAPGLAGGPAGLGSGLPSPLTVGAERPTAVAVVDRPSGRASGTLGLARPFPASWDVGGSLPELAIRPRPPVAVLRRELAPAVMGIAVGTDDDPERPVARARGTRAHGGPAAGAAPVEADPCADARAVAAERCEAADTARGAARASASALRDAQRAYADLTESVEAAGALADPRHVSDEKERLHAAFRGAHERASGHDEAEAAAREWLTEISHLNATTRDALHRVRAGTAELRTRAAALERREMDDNAARISAETAEAACRDAREAASDCEERWAAERPTPAPEEPNPNEALWSSSEEGAFERNRMEPVDLEGTPAIIRVLRGDDAARERLVTSLAGGDRSSMPEWHVRVARFVDAVVSRAIEAGYLELPGDDPFWHLFSGDERREIVGALSALGYRFDGMGGFADERAPTARDLSLAVGYAGLDPMRIRTWPRDAEIAALYAHATVAADLWLADEADDLALGRVIDALGPRAAELADLWDAWSRVRPAFLLEV